MTYRPSNFLSSVQFARQDRCLSIGMFGGLQAAFEHKPWVESSIAALGIPHVPWVYVADEEQLRARGVLAQGPIMLRRSRTSGGEGLVYVDDLALLSDLWPYGADAFVSIAPYVEALPVNVGATVWRDQVTVHHPSVQLIGIESCTKRRFGYCGNDFGGIKELSASTVEVIETSTKVIGDWLRRHGYRGTFGVDYLVKDGVPLVAEVNARFQGSTHASAQLSVEAGESCLYLDHLAAMLGLDPPSRPSLVESYVDVPDLSHVVVHWTGASGARIDPAELVREAQQNPRYDRSDVATSPHYTTEPGGVAVRLTIRDSITETGFELAESWSTIVGTWIAVDSEGQEPGKC